MPTETLEHIISLLGYAGIFLLMIANGVVSFPSSQILYIVAGYFIATGDLALPAVVMAGAAGNTVGNIILYEIARAKGFSYLTRWKIFPEREVRKVQVAFEKRGAWFLLIGKLLPAIKVFVPIPAGIARMHRGLYAAIIAVGSTLWTFPFLAIGYYFGKTADVFGAYATVLAIIALFIVFVFYKYMSTAEVLRGVAEFEEREKQQRER